MFNVLGAYTCGMVLAFTSSWQITLIALSCSPLMVISAQIQAQLAQGFSQKSDELFKEAGQIINETISNIRTVSSFGNQDYIQDMYKRQIAEPLRICSRNGIKAGLAFGFSQINIFLLYAVIFYSGACLVRDGKIFMVDMFSALFCIMFAAFSVG